MIQILKELASHSIEINRHDKQITDALAKAPIYKKQGEVRVVFAKGGERVITVLAGGLEETVNTANPGDVIITNPTGEQYIIDQTKFLKRYEPKAGASDIYVAKGYCRAIDNPEGAPIQMMASWGEMQFGDTYCKIADTFDPITGEFGGQPYIIDRTSFEQTYVLAGQLVIFDEQ